MRLRITALLTAISFLATNTSFAQLPASLTPIDRFTVSAGIPGRISIPESLGSIEAQHKAESDKPFIIYIQDAHAIVDAQNHIQELIQYLQEKYGVSLIALEGAKGKLDPTLFRTFPDAFVKKKVLNEYLERGEFTGAQMAAVFNSKEAAYYGIEDWNLYQENYFAYLRAAKNKEEILRRLSEIKVQLDQERKKIYSAPLNEFHEHIQAFQEERSYLVELLKYLASLKPSTEKYPHLQKLMASLASSEALQKKNLDVSVRKMAESFKKKYGLKLNQKEAMAFNENYQSYVTGGIAPGDFLKFLITAAQSIGIHPKLTPLMQELLGQSQTLSIIKGTRVFTELESLIEEMEKSLTTSPEEKELAGKYKRLNLMKDLASMELTREQLSKYQKEPREYLNLLQASDKLLGPALEFYRIALERDRVFHNNLAELMKSEKAKSAIVLAGGFHSTGFEETLKEEGYSYAVVTPKISSLAGHEAYAEVMQGKLSYKSYLETTFYDAFVRHASRQLVGQLNEPDFKRDLKLWRDEVIRKLSSEGRITQASDYTRYIDLLFKDYYEKFGADRIPKTKEEILKALNEELDRFSEGAVNNLWQKFQIQFKEFTAGLQQLIETKQLNVEKVSGLLEHLGQSRPTALQSIAVAEMDPSVPVFELGTVPPDRRSEIRVSKKIVAGVAATAVATAALFLGAMQNNKPNVEISKPDAGLAIELNGRKYEDLNETEKKILERTIAEIILPQAKQKDPAIQNFFENKEWKNFFRVIPGDKDSHDPGAAGLGGHELIAVNEAALKAAVSEDPEALEMLAKTLVHEAYHQEHSKSGEMQKRSEADEEKETRINSLKFFDQTPYEDHGKIFGIHIPLNTQREPQFEGGRLLVYVNAYKNERIDPVIFNNAVIQEIQKLLQRFPPESEISQKLNREIEILKTSSPRSEVRSFSEKDFDRWSENLSADTREILSLLSVDEKAEIWNVLSGSALIFEDRWKEIAAQIEQWRQDKSVRVKMQSEADRNAGIYFYHGDLFEHDQGGIAFEFGDTFPSLDERTDLSKQPDPGTQYAPQPDQRRIRNIWRFIDMSRFPPIKIYVKGVVNPNGVKKMLQIYGWPTGISIEAWPVNKNINRDHLYHSVNMDRWGNMIRYRALLSGDEEYLRARLLIILVKAVPSIKGIYRAVSDIASHSPDLARSEVRKGRPEETLMNNPGLEPFGFDMEQIRRILEAPSLFALPNEFLRLREFHFQLPSQVELNAAEQQITEYFDKKWLYGRDSNPALSQLSNEALWRAIEKNKKFQNFLGAGTLEKFREILKNEHVRTFFSQESPYSNGLRQTALLLALRLSQNPNLSIPAIVSAIQEDMERLHLQEQKEGRLFYSLGVEVEITEKNAGPDFDARTAAVIFHFLLGGKLGFDEEVEYALEPAYSEAVVARNLQLMEELGLIPQGKPHNMHINTLIPESFKEIPLIGDLAKWITFAGVAAYTDRSRVEQFTKEGWRPIDRKGDEVQNIDGKKPKVETEDEKEMKKIRLEYRLADSLDKDSSRYFHFLHGLMMQAAITAYKLSTNPQASFNRLEYELAKNLDQFLREMEALKTEMGPEASVLDLNWFDSSSPEMGKKLNALKNKPELVSRILQIIEAALSRNQQLIEKAEEPEMRETIPTDQVSAVHVIQSLAAQMKEAPPQKIEKALQDFQSRYLNFRQFSTERGFPSLDDLEPYRRYYEIPDFDFERHRFEMPSFDRPAFEFPRIEIPKFEVQKIDFNAFENIRQVLLIHDQPWWQKILFWLAGFLPGLGPALRGWLLQRAAVQSLRTRQRQIENLKQMLHEWEGERRISRQDWTQWLRAEQQKGKFKDLPYEARQAFEASLRYRTVLEKAFDPTGRRDASRLLPLRENLSDEVLNEALKELREIALAFENYRAANFGRLRFDSRAADYVHKIETELQSRHVRSEVRSRRKVKTISEGFRKNQKYFVEKKEAEQFVPEEIRVLFDIAEHLGLPMVITGGTARDFAVSIISRKKVQFPQTTDFDIAIPFAENTDNGTKIRLLYHEAAYQLFKNELMQKLKKMGYSKKAAKRLYLDFLPGIYVQGPDQSDTYVFQHLINTKTGNAFSISRLAVERVNGEYVILGDGEALQDLKERRLRIWIAPGSTPGPMMAAKMLGKAAIYQEIGNFKFDAKSKLKIFSDIRKASRSPEETQEFLGNLFRHLRLMDEGPATSKKRFRNVIREFRLEKIFERSSKEILKIAAPRSEVRTEGVALNIAKPSATPADSEALRPYLLQLDREISSLDPPNPGILLKIKQFLNSTSRPISEVTKKQIREAVFGKGWIGGLRNFARFLALWIEKIVFFKSMQWMIQLLRRFAFGKTDKKIQELKKIFGERFESGLLKRDGNTIRDLNSGTILGRQLENHVQIYRIIDHPDQIIKISNDPKERRRIIREARMLFELERRSVTGIPRVKKFGFLENGDVWVRLETLENALSIDHYRFGNPQIILKILSIVGNALKGIHQAGFVHNDTKPANILMNRRGIQIIDFESVTKIGDRLNWGTSGFFPLSPDLTIEKERKEDSDVYSFVITIADLLNRNIPRWENEPEKKEQLILLRNFYLGLIFKNPFENEIGDLTFNIERKAADAVLQPYAREKRPSLDQIISYLKTDRKFIASYFSQTTRVSAPASVRSEVREGPRNREEVIRLLEEAGYQNPQQLFEAVTSHDENKLSGVGGEGIVYRIPNAKQSGLTTGYVLHYRGKREEALRDLPPSFQDAQGVEDIFPKGNVGQAILKLAPAVRILMEVSGYPLGIVRKKLDLEPAADRTKKIAWYERHLSTISSWPQESYDQLAQTVEDLNNEGIPIDPKPSNMLVDVENQRFHYVDVSKEKVAGIPNGLGHMLMPLMMGNEAEFLEDYLRKDSQKDTKEKEAQLGRWNVYRKEIFEKALRAAIAHKFYFGLPKKDNTVWNYWFRLAGMTHEQGIAFLLELNPNLAKQAPRSEMRMMNLFESFKGKRIPTPAEVKALLGQRIKLNNLHQDANVHDVELNIEHAELFQKGQDSRSPNRIPMRISFGVWIRGERTGRVSLKRFFRPTDGKQTNPVNQKVIYQIDEFMPFGKIGGEFYKTYGNSRVGTTILNWIVWLANQDQAILRDDGTANFRLMLLHKKYFGETYRFARVRGAPSSNVSDFDEGAIFEKTEWTPSETLENPVWFKVRREKNLFKIENIQGEMPGFQVGDSILIDARGFISTPQGNPLGRVHKFANDISFEGKPQNFVEPQGILLPRSEVRSVIGNQLRAERLSYLIYTLPQEQQNALKEVHQKLFEAIRNTDIDPQFRDYIPEVSKYLERYRRMYDSYWQKFWAMFVFPLDSEGDVVERFQQVLTQLQTKDEQLGLKIREIENIMGELKQTTLVFEDQPLFKEQPSERKIVLPQAFEVGGLFDESRIDALSLESRTRISDSEEAITYQGKTYVVWVEGPRKGQIYRIIDKPSADVLSKVPSMDEIFKEVDRRISGIVEKDDAKRSEANDLWINLLLWLHQLYNGTPQRLGLETARLYSPARNNFVHQIQEEGLERWIINRAKAQGYSEKKFLFGQNNEFRDAFWNYYYGRKYPTDVTERNIFYNEIDPITFGHGSYNNVLSTVIQLGGLGSPDFLKANGITKITGETTKARGHNPTALSFWSHPDGRPSIVGGYGSQVGFELPIVFGISRSNALRLNFHDGAMYDEVAVSNFVPLEAITHIFVPYFVINQTKEILNEHGYTHIKILPLGFDNNQPIINLKRSEVRSGDVFDEQWLKSFPETREFKVLLAAYLQGFERRSDFDKTLIERLLSASGAITPSRNSDLIKEILTQTGAENFDELVMNASQWGMNESMEGGLREAFLKVIERVDQSKRRDYEAAAVQASQMMAAKMIERVKLIAAELLGGKVEGMAAALKAVRGNGSRSQQFRQKYARILEGPIENDADLRLAMEFIKEISPNFGRKIIEEVEARKIPVKMTQSRVSNAEKSLYSVLNRESAYASRINIRVGASILEVIHEFAHSVPINKLPAPLSSVVNIRVNTQDDVETIKATLVWIGYLEEAVAVAAEIHLLEDIEKSGFIEKDEMENFAEGMGPSARGVYNEQNRDINQLAASIPTLFPFYKDYEEDFAEKNKATMKRPVGELMNIPWGDKLAGFGITVTTEEGRTQVGIDTQQLVTSATNVLASDTPENLISKALDRVGTLLNKFNQQRRGSEKVTPDSLQSLEFPPQTKQNPTNAAQVLEQEKEQMVNRVKIGGSFLQFLEKMEDSEQGGASRYFSEAIVAAKHLDGDQASVLWKKLYEAAKAKIQEKPDFMKELGFALLEAGYTEQGVYALQAYVNAALDNLSIWSEWGETKAGKFLTELIEHNQFELAKTVHQEILSSIRQLKRYYHDSMIRHYGEFEGEFLGQGKAELEKFLSENAHRHITVEEFNKQILILRSRGLYQFSEHGDPTRIWRSDEENYYERLAALSGIASDLSKVSKQLADKDREMAQSFGETAALAYDLATMGSVERLKLRIKEWEEKFEVRYSGDIKEFVNAVERHPQSSKDFEFERSLVKEVTDVGWSLIRDGNLRKIFDFLKSLPDGNFKLSLYESAANSFKGNEAPELVEEFIKDWETTLHAVVKKEAANFFIDMRVFNSPERRQQTIKSWIKSRFEEEEQKLGIQYSISAVIRNFAKRNFHSDTSTMSEDDIMEQLYEHYGKKDVQALKTLIRAVQGMDLVSQIYLLKRFIWFIPASAPQEYINEYLGLLNNALAAYARQSGLATPNKIELATIDYRQSYLFQKHQAAMAQAALKNQNPAVKTHGGQRLIGLSGNTAAVLSPREYMSPTRDLFGTDKGGTIYTMNEFVPAIFKIQQLLDASEADVQNQAVYLKEAEGLLGALSTNPVTEELISVENKLFTLMRMIVLYAKNGQLEKAEALFKRIQLDLHRVKVEHARRLQEFQDLKPAEKEAKGYMASYDLEGNVKKLEFWEQDLESRQTTILARYAFGFDQARALARLDEVVAAFEREVSLRRDRFDSRSMVSAASVLEEVPELQGHAQRIYSLAIDKLALLRGNKDLFNDGASLLVDRIDNGKLSNVQKDVLLAKAMQTLVPPKGKRNWVEITETLPGLMKLAEKAIREKIYPETEKEVLHLFVDISEETQFDRNDWKNGAKLTGLSVMFDKVASANPEIAVHENFPALLGLSEDPKYREGLSGLHRETWKGHLKTNGNGVSLEAIRSGAIDTNEALNKVLPKVDAAIEKQDTLALNASTTLLGEIIDKEIAAFLSKQEGRRSEMRQLTLDQLKSIPSFNELYGRVEPFLFSREEKTATQERLIDVLLDGRNKETAKAKYALYKELLANPKVHVSVQRKAFNGLILAERIDSYAESFFNDDVLAKEKIGEERFYGWIKKSLDLNDDHLPADSLLAYLFQNPSKETEFFAKYERMKSMGTVQQYSRDWQHEVHKALDRWNWRGGSNNDYQATHQRMTQKYNIWVPDLFDEIDLLLAYHARFSHFRGFAQWVEDIRHWYVYDVYQVGAHDSARHTVENLEHALGKLVPHVKLTGEQRDYLRKYLAANGTISYKSLTQYLGVEFEGRIQNELITLLNVRLEPYTEAVPETFGIPNLSTVQKRQLDEQLDRLKRDFDERLQKTQQEKIEVPAVFENSPPLIKFALISYFKQLPFGEREAILNDFKTEGLTEEQALKRFFEVTGNEKLGQFLSLRRDLIPERFRKELERFQENVEPSAFEEMKSTIEKELGAPISSLFVSINPTPLKVGTIGEVYEVTLLDGTKAIVKVITPSKRKAIEQNLMRIRAVAFDVDRNKSRFDQKVDVLSMFREFERSIREEMDLTVEYRNAQQFKEVLPAGISMPTFYEQFARPSVFVQSFAEGQNPLEVPVSVQQSVAIKLGAMLIDHVLSRDIYHDDLHPGNIRVDAQGNIVLLDFGRVGHLSASDRETLIPLLLAIHSKDDVGILEVLEKMGTAAHDYDREGLKASIKKTISNGLPITTLISTVFHESGNHGLEIKGVFLQLIKGILTFEGTANKLNPNYNLENQVKSIAMQNLAKNVISNLFGGWKRSEVRIELGNQTLRLFLPQGNAEAIVKDIEQSNLEQVANGWKGEAQTNKDKVRSELRLQLNDAIVGPIQKLDIPEMAEWLSNKENRSEVRKQVDPRFGSFIPDLFVRLQGRFYQEISGLALPEAIASESLDLSWLSPKMMEQLILLFNNPQLLAKAEQERPGNSSETNLSNDMTVGFDADLDPENIKEILRLLTDNSISRIALFYPKENSDALKAARGNPKILLVPYGNALVKTNAIPASESASFIFSSDLGGRLALNGRPGLRKQALRISKGLYAELVSKLGRPLATRFLISFSQNTLLRHQYLDGQGNVIPQIDGRAIQSGLRYYTDLLTTQAVTEKAAGTSA